MKISDCPNAPTWLIEAKTTDADVTISSSGWVTWNAGQFLGGEFRGGYFLGGEFHGGQFLGGEFRGGYFRGGEFRGGYFLGGEFRGGQFLGGQFLGGQFLGGEFLGGQFLGGEFLGGEFRGGYFRGGAIRETKPRWILTVIPGIEGYPKTLCDVDGVAWILAGCQWFTLAQAIEHWKDREDRPITRALLAGVAQLAKDRGLKIK